MLPITLIVSCSLHVPEIRINKLPPLAPGKTTSVVLSIINPTERVLRVSLLPNEAKKKDVCNTEVMWHNWRFFHCRRFNFFVFAYCCKSCEVQRRKNVLLDDFFSV